MSDSKGKKPITVADMVALLPERLLPVIAEGAAAGEVVNGFADFQHSRLLYVLDAEGRLAGVISLGRMIRHVLNSYHEPRIHSRHLLNLLGSKTAFHLMQKETVSARLSEDLEKVLRRMIDNNIKEIPILDENSKVVADLTMVDILKYYKLVDRDD